MNKILLFATADGLALVLEVQGEEAESILEECGRSMDDWPDDCGIYGRSPGLWVWEGEIDEDDVFQGSLRELKAIEMNRIDTHKAPVLD